MAVIDTAAIEAQRLFIESATDPTMVVQLEQVFASSLKRARAGVAQCGSEVARLRERIATLEARQEKCSADIERHSAALKAATLRKRELRAEQDEMLAERWADSDDAIVQSIPAPEPEQPQPQIPPPVPPPVPPPGAPVEIVPEPPVQPMPDAPSAGPIAQLDPNALGGIDLPLDNTTSNPTTEQ